ESVWGFVVDEGIHFRGRRWKSGQVECDPAKQRDSIRGWIGLQSIGLHLGLNERVDRVSRGVRHCRPLDTLEGPKLPLLRGEGIFLGRGSVGSKCGDTKEDCQRQADSWNAVLHVCSALDSICLKYKDFNSPKRPSTDVDACRSTRDPKRAHGAQAWLSAIAIAPQPSS